jgi:hypothetical protein
LGKLDRVDVYPASRINENSHSYGVLLCYNNVDVFFSFFFFVLDQKSVASCRSLYSWACNATTTHILITCCDTGTEAEAGEVASAKWCRCASKRLE